MKRIVKKSLQELIKFDLILSEIWRLNDKNISTDILKERNIINSDKDLKELENLGLVEKRNAQDKSIIYMSYRAKDIYENFGSVIAYVKNEKKKIYYKITMLVIAILTLIIVFFDFFDLLAI